MSSPTYLVHAIGWSSAGAVVGVLLDRAVLALRQIARSPRQEDPVQTPDPSPRRQRVRRVFGASVVPAVLIVLAVVSAVQGWTTSRTNAAQDAEVTRVQTCQLAYANGFADAIDARANATREAQDALDELMTVVGELTSSGGSAAAGERFRAALSDYLTKRATAKQRQLDNPYPPAPRDLCR